MVDMDTLKIFTSQDTSCANNPCQNTAKCHDNLSTGYRCECPFGWLGKNCDHRAQIPDTDYTQAEMGNCYLKKKSIINYITEKINYQLTNKKL